MNARMPKPRPLPPQTLLDLKHRMVDRLIAEGVRPTVKPTTAPKPVPGRTA